MKLNLSVASVERGLNALTAVIFVGALIYFIATVRPALVPLGDGQQFCQCTVASSITIAGSDPSYQCVAQVQPTTNEQIPGFFYDDYFNRQNHTSWNTPISPCADSDVSTLSVHIGAASFEFPNLGASFDCFSSTFPAKAATEWYANVTSGGQEFAGNQGTFALREVYAFTTPVYSLYVVHFADYGTMDAMQQQVLPCIVFLDARDWQSHCTCPLNVIGNAVSIASITALVLFPIKFYRSALAKDGDETSAKKKNDAMVGGEA